MEYDINVVALTELVLIILKLSRGKHRGRVEFAYN